MRCTLLGATALLLVLQLAHGDARRSKIGDLGERNVSKEASEGASRHLYASLTAHRTGVKNDVSRSLNTFSQYLPISALHDSIEQEVIVNALVTDRYASEIAGCVFVRDGAAQQSSIPLELLAVERYSYTQQGNWTEHRITCGVPAEGNASGWIDVKLATGIPGGHPLLLEILHTNSSGRVALCGPTIYSHMPWTADFVKHYKRLGVDEFHFYLPEGPVLDDFLADPVSADGVYSMAAGSLSTKRVQPFEHPLVHWHNFTTTPNSASFNLRAGINDCISRLRYSHKYAVIADMDEFFHIAKASGVTLIRDLMDKYLPASVASLGFADVHYPRDCPVGVVLFDAQQMPEVWSGLFSDLYTLHFPLKIFPTHADEYWRTKVAVNGQPYDQWVKSIVRVQDVFSGNAHGPEMLHKTANQSGAFLPHYIAHYKHIRHRGSTTCVFGPQAMSNWIFQPDAILQWAEP